MNNFYEERRDNDTKIHCKRCGPHAFPAHFHQNMELYIIRRGRYEIDIGEEKLILVGPCVVVIDSFEVHRYYKGSDDADDCTVIIPYRYLDRFNRERGNRALAEHVIKDDVLVDRLLGIIDGFIIPRESESIVDSGTALLLSLLLARLSLSDKSLRDDTALIRRILLYIQENYRSNISRARIAAAFGYTEAHISRVFNKIMHRGISDYVASLRLNYVEECRRTGDARSLTELVYDAGFGSMESYYRQKRIPMIKH